MRAPLEAIREFLKLESASGVLLMLAGALAMLAANSPLASAYASALQIPLVLSIGTFALAKPLLLWINDGLMALFFLVVGLELKREFLEGELADRSQIVLPAAGAIGGMVVPAAIYALFNLGDAAALRGWAIPSATDIAFALGVLALLGSRVPLALKVLLMTLATLDDLGAIVLIAVFFTSQLSFLSLCLAALALGALVLLNRLGVTRLAPYLLVGIVLWICVVKSGVHATLAGVATAFAIPLRGRDMRGQSPLHVLEETLHPWVAFGVLPLFAFANAGVNLSGLHPASLVEPIPLGIAAGLFIGKQLGVFLFAAAVVRAGAARLPEGATWRHLYGVALLCGIGFTMSLFIGSLAFDETASGPIVTDRLGIIAGSLLSAVAGFTWLRLTLLRPHGLQGKPG
jgi:NhaA family Na+:H+ antiporter